MPDKNREIEEMANAYYEAMLKARATLGSMNEGAPKWYAKAFYNAGYRKNSDIAREIFEEIEEIRLRQIRKSEFFRNGSNEEMERKFYEGAEWGLRQLSHWFAELKKEYTESEDMK